MNNGLCRPGQPQSENQRKRKEIQVFRPWQRINKRGNMKMTVVPIVNGSHGTISKGLVRGLE